MPSSHLFLCGPASGTFLMSQRFTSLLRNLSQSLGPGPLASLGLTVGPSMGWGWGLGLAPGLKSVYTSICLTAVQGHARSHVYMT